MTVSWRDIQSEALRRIRAREWTEGALIPNETDLAREFGCARATVNRALQALADDGWLDRRRRAGTRVASAPLRRAQLSIPLIRDEIEGRGQAFSHRLVTREPGRLPLALAAKLELADGTQALHLRTLYLADARPFAFEDRWVCLASAPGIAEADLERVSPNEWLVRHTAFSGGTLDYAAEAASAEMAEWLGCPVGAPLLVLERQTFGPQGAVTHVRLTHAPGHRLRLEI